MDRMQTPRTVAVDVFSVVHFVIHKIVSNYHITLARCMEAKILLLITERLYSQKQSDKLKF